ncbi:protein enabled homolog [Heterocephalus glaber]|uniref:Protein enabled homolog n=1 Tax=Heterocephalus glaber TaxID=10181 RepID=A0AAX6TJB7_HETGA|nr:protein enabled homolog [Heterocephalus glaber]
MLRNWWRNSKELSREELQQLLAEQQMAAKELSEEEEHLQAPFPLRRLGERRLSRARFPGAPGKRTPGRGLGREQPRGARRPKPRLFTGAVALPHPLTGSHSVSCAPLRRPRASPALGLRPRQAPQAARRGLRPKGRRPASDNRAGEAGRRGRWPAAAAYCSDPSPGRPLPTGCAARRSLTALVRAAAPLSSESPRPSLPPRQLPSSPPPPSTLTLSQAAGPRPSPPLPPAPPPAPHLLLLRPLLQQGPSCWSASSSSSSSSSSSRSSAAPSLVVLVSFLFLRLRPAPETGAEKRLSVTPVLLSSPVPRRTQRVQPPRAVAHPKDLPNHCSEISLQLSPEQ